MTPQVVRRELALLNQNRLQLEERRGALQIALEHAYGLPTERFDPSDARRLQRDLDRVGADLAVLAGRETTLKRALPSAGAITAAEQDLVRLRETVAKADVAFHHCARAYLNAVEHAEETARALVAIRRTAVEACAAMIDVAGAAGLAVEAPTAPALPAVDAAVARLSAMLCGQAADGDVDALVFTHLAAARRTRAA